MKRLLLVLGLTALPVIAASAAENRPAAPGCSVAGSDPVTLACPAVSPAFGAQLADVLTTILERRLDPQQVLDKLAEIEPAPAPGVARALDPVGRQLVITSLYGKPTGTIAIVADPVEGDAVGYGTSIAAPLSMVGWQISGNQISRKTLPPVAEMRGVAVLVRDAGAPPPAATELKAALATAHIIAPIRADPTLAADAIVLWIGKRPQFNPNRPPPPKS